MPFELPWRHFADPKEFRTHNMIQELSKFLVDSGDVVRAIVLHKELLVTARSELANDRFLLMLLRQLARFHENRNELTEAILLCEEALPLIKRFYGEESKDTMTAMHNLAFLYWQAGRLTDSIALFEQTSELKTKKLGRRSQHLDLTKAAWRILPPCRSGR